MDDLLDLENGAVLRVYKPYTWTSFDVTKKIQRLILRRVNRLRKDQNLPKKKVKVGHAGTLDPLATGLLIVCVGKETKNIEKYMGMPKTYTGEFFLGAETPSYDRETEANQTYDIQSITPQMIEAAAQTLCGELDQIPPLFSAIKQDGVRAYEMARAGSEVQLKSRKVLVSRFDITHINLPYIGFEIECSKGTYIRSLARDFGKALNNGAYLWDLRRTKIGSFKIEEAITPDELSEMFGESQQYRQDKENINIGSQASNVKKKNI